jgi:tRNA(His) guanylyltransferase
MSGSDKTALGDRMKRFEAATFAVLPRRTYTLVRVDVRAAHSYLRAAVRPFDAAFAADMDATAEALCREVSGAVFAYTQSDEISVLAVDFGSTGTEPWFGGEVQKIVSISAAVATAALNARRPGRTALFDARVFTIADPVEVANYFCWRQRDAVRNSISMAAQAHFSHRELHGVNTGQMQDLLWSRKAVNWNDYADGFKRGRVIVKETGEREVTYVDRRTEVEHTTTAVRSWWVARPAPHFTLNPGGFLPATIPPMPRLDVAAA